MEHLQNESVKETLSANRFFEKFNKYKLYFCNIIIEIMDVKCELLSKHLFERKQQHDSCTKPLGNDKFV